VISYQSFLKRLKTLGLPEEGKRLCYSHTIEILAEYEKEDPDCAKIREIEEKYQWPILSKLDDPTSNFYENVEEESKREFINLILDEKKLRLNSKTMLEVDYEKEINRIIAKRVKYFVMMLNFTAQDAKDFKKNPLKFLAIIAALAGLTGTAIFIFGKIRDKNSEKSKEKKEGEK